MLEKFNKMSEFSLTYVPKVISLDKCSCFLPIEISFKNIEDFSNLFIYRNIVAVYTLKSNETIVLSCPQSVHDIEKVTVKKVPDCMFFYGNENHGIFKKYINKKIERKIGSMGHTYNCYTDYGQLIGDKCEWEIKNNKNYLYNDVTCILPKPVFNIKDAVSLVDFYLGDKISKDNIETKKYYAYVETPYNKELLNTVNNYANATEDFNHDRCFSALYFDNKKSSLRSNENYFCFLDKQNLEEKQYLCIKSITHFNLSSITEYPYKFDLLLSDKSVQYIISPPQSSTKFEINKDKNLDVLFFKAKDKNNIEVIDGNKNKVVANLTLPTTYKDIFLFSNEIISYFKNDNFKILNF